MKQDLKPWLILVDYAYLSNEYKDLRNKVVSGTILDHELKKNDKFEDNGSILKFQYKYESGPN